MLIAAREVVAEGDFVVVVPIDRGVDDRHRTRDRDPHGIRRARSGYREITDQRRGVQVVDLSCHCRQESGYDTTKAPRAQLAEVETGEVATLVVNVVLTPHLAIGHDIDPGFHLVGDDLGSGPPEQALRRSPCLRHLAGESCRVVRRGIVVIRVREPV